MPVSVGSDRSRRVRPLAGASSRTFTRAVISSAWRRSRPQVVGDAEPRGDDPRDVGGGVADLLDRAGDPQDPGHALGVLGAAGGEHRHDAQPAQVVVHARLEPVDLARELLLVEEDRRVGEVDHQLGGVLQLDEQLFDVLRLFIH